MSIFTGEYTKTQQGKWIIQCHSTSRWSSWDSNTGLSDSTTPDPKKKKERRGKEMVTVSVEALVVELEYVLMDE